VKAYRVSLEVVTSLDFTAREMTELLGVPERALTWEHGRAGIRWRYQPSTRQMRELGGQIHRLASRLRPRWTRSHRDRFQRVSLGIEVEYDTCTCTTNIPLCGLVYGNDPLARVLPQLSSIELACAPVDEDIAPSELEGKPSEDPGLTAQRARELYEAWKASEALSPSEASLAVVPDLPPALPGAECGRGNSTNAYMVSLNAITTHAATVLEVAEVLGLSSDALVMRPLADGSGLMWRGEIEAENQRDLSAHLRRLESRIRPRRPFEPGGSISEIYLDVGVIYHSEESETCLVSLPVSILCSLSSKLFMSTISVSCYPGSDEATCAVDSVDL